MCKRQPKHRIISRLFAFYRYFFSPWVGNNCRFYPTCSRYSEDAIEIHGIVKGLYLTVIRLAKCNPWHPGGFDEVPPKNKSQKKEQ